MSDTNRASYTLVISCPDKVGIVAAVSQFVAQRSGSLVESNHHTDVEQGWFYMRNVIIADSLAVSLQQFREEFTILADEGGKTSKAYGVLKDYKLLKLASRQSFLVDPEGKIVKHYADVDPDEHTDQVLADIKVFMEGAVNKS